MYDMIAQTLELFNPTMDYITSSDTMAECQANLESMFILSNSNGWLPELVNKVDNTFYATIDGTMWLVSCIKG